MDPLAQPTNFRSLSLKDLLEAREAYHWHLMNKANVVGTAVGAYLIRDADDGAAKGGRKPRRLPRTFENSSVRDISWPCVLVLVRDWVEASGFGGADGKFAPQDMVPKTLFMADGRVVPVCVVQVSPAEAQTSATAPADVRWPNSMIGGGFPLTVEAQGERRQASVGCLVTDGHTVYGELCDHYIALGGGTAKPVIQGLWDTFGERTATLMAAGANTLAATWEAALAVSGVTLPGPETFSEQALATIYQDTAFVPSFTLDEIGPHLSAPDTSAPQPPLAQAAPPTAAPVKAPRRGARRPQP